MDSIDNERAQFVARCEEIRALLEPRITILIGALCTHHNGTIDHKKLPRVAREIAMTCWDEIQEIAKGCFSREMFPNLPTPKLYGCDGGGDPVPDVYLMMWRKGGMRPEATSIHDHGKSRVGVYVMQGEVSEYVYGVDPKAWRDHQNPLQYTIWRRRLSAGKSLYVPAPYIHRMMDHVREGFAVHVYANPPLDEQTSYVRVGDMLYRGEQWREEGLSACAYATGEDVAA